MVAVSAALPLVARFLLCNAMEILYRSVTIVGG